MAEKEPIVEVYQAVPLDEKIFDRVKTVAEEMPSGDAKELLLEAVGACKKSSFELAEEALSKMLGEEPPAEKETEAKDQLSSEPKPSHRIISSFSALESAMDFIGIPRDRWPSNDDKNKLQNLMKRAALGYAFHTALDYEKLMAAKPADREKNLEKLGLRGAVPAEYLENRVIKKINELPVALKEHLLG